MSSPSYDVVVIGAGPAGLMTARALAERGHHVVVLEEHARVGLPVHCTGIVGLEAFDEIDLPSETILGVAHSAVFCGPSGGRALFRSERVLAAVLDRGAFDAALAQRAETAGVDMRCGARVESVDVTSDRVTVRLAGFGDVSARACVVACGASYRLNRQLGLGIPGAFLQTAQVETPFPSLEHIEVHFGRAVAPGGFAWVVPFSRGGASLARIGIMCHEGAGTRFAAFVQQLSEREGLGGFRCPDARRKVIPLGLVSKTYAPRVVAVGDAAGLIKPTTGGGIYFGLLSGSIAADVLDEALHRDMLGANGLKAYDTRWRARLGAEIRAGLAFRAVAARLDDRAIDQLVDLGRGDDLAALLLEHGRFNWHRKAAMALLGSAAFRRIALSSFWRQRVLPRGFQPHAAAHAS